jgi:hypothetical protein
LDAFQFARQPRRPHDFRDEGGSFTFPLGRSVLAQLGPEVDLRIDNRTSFEVTLVDGLFRNGGIDNVVVPEPSSLALAATTLVAPLFASRRRSTRL